MKDFLGKDIESGKTVCYPIRRGSWVGMGKARVLYTLGNRLHAMASARRGNTEYEVLVELVQPSRCVVVD